MPSGEEDEDDLKQSFATDYVSSNSKFGGIYSPMNESAQTLLDVNAVPELDSQYPTNEKSAFDK